MKIRYNRDIWEGFYGRLYELFSLIGGRKVILWGYGTSGRFVEHLFMRNNRRITSIIDTHNEGEEHVESPRIIDDSDPLGCFVILTFDMDKEVEKKLYSNAYKKDLDFVYIRAFFYGNNGLGKPFDSYQRYLEYIIGADFVTCKDDDLIRSNQDAVM